MPEPMNKEEALRIVVNADKDARKLLLNTLLEEMKTEDAEEVLEQNGYVPD